ncbi:hypothetical protein [Streptomyces sp. NPDC056244]|uniref:hypothetical protein n=1 Tax=unclassified Streptomyces TaxID=2593676 RepID=UPI0035D5625B
MRRRAEDLTAEARRAGFLVSDGECGRVTVMEAQCTPEGPGQARLDLMRWYADTLTGMTNTTGAVTVVPGADGRPQVTLDYQVNVWDRYNWDAGKATPIGPTTVTDADMARLHTTGLAREFDMRGSGSTQHLQLGSEPAQLPDPPDPGREGTRQDPGREGIR